MADKRQFLILSERI